jgi:glucan 1,3-beta-glucosidase
VHISNCGIGLDIANQNGERQAVGSVVFIDSSITNTPVGVRTIRSEGSSPATGGSLVLENVRLNNVPTAVQGAGAVTLLAGSGGAATIAAWVQGHAYTPAGPTTVQGPVAANARPDALTAGTDFYERSQPQYKNVHVSQFLSARDGGAIGDGVADDTAALNTLFAASAATGKVAYLDMGYYKVTGTVHIPAGAKIFGEAFPVILSTGAYFNDMNNPKPVVQVGAAGGETGSIEWINTIVSPQGAQAGAILIEYNLASPTNAPSGLWDVHTRIGGFTGSGHQVAECPKTPNTPLTNGNIPNNCVAAFMSMHITKPSSGLYMENCWLWVADHDLDDQTLTQITVYAGRGLLVESEAGGIWLWGTSVEHHVLYEYQLVGTQKVVMGQIQTETAYYQPNPDARSPFPAVAALRDPVFAAGESGWGLRVVDSSDVLVYGAGLYSFFKNYDVSCAAEGNASKCQSRIFSVENSQNVAVYNLDTVGTTKMATVDGVDVADWADNFGGFVSTIALFRK